MPAGSSETRLPNHQGGRAGHTMGWGTFTSGRPLPTSPNCATCRIQVHCRWAQEETAPSDLELAWQAQDFQEVSTQQLIEVLIPTLNLPEESRQTKEGSLLRRLEVWSVQQWQQQSEKAF